MQPFSNNLEIKASVLVDAGRTKKIWWKETVFLVENKVMVTKGGVGRDKQGVWD